MVKGLPVPKLTGCSGLKFQYPSVHYFEQDLGLPNDQCGKENFVPLKELPV